MKKYALQNDVDIIMAKVPEALNQFIENGFNRQMGSSICHGIFGNIDILTEILAQFKDSDLIKKKDELFKECLAYIEEDGIAYGINDTLAMLGFMNGISGIGYSILRQKNRKLPSILSLKVVESEVVNT